MPLLSYAATYDGGVSLISQIRLRIMDVDVETQPPAQGTDRADWSCLFVDSEIAATANLYPLNTVNLAAADLLDNIASNSALLAKLIKIGDYEEDTRNVASALHRQAEALRHALDSIPFEQITDEAYTDFNWNRMLFRPGVGG